MKMRTAIQLCLVFVALISSPSYAQLGVFNGFTAQQLGNNLAGNNVNIFNPTITGDPVQYGTFTYQGNDLGLNSGVILSTGDIFDAVGPNTDGGTSTNIGGPGDPDLSNLAGFNTNDAVVLEFDFEVQGDEIEFNFVFMSEEYNEYVGTGFNDVFAFFISGPGIVGQENLAVVPGTTTPVTINTINNGSFWQYYNDNESGGVNIEFDGFTTLMTAFKDSLIPCGVYTLSLRIADGSDSALDSGVLLEENSLVQSNISASSSTFSANNTALEGCIEASFTFQLDSIMPEDVTIPISIGGTATNGVDYAQIDSLITIPAGQLSATIIIDAVADGLTEGTEVVELYFSPSPCEPQDTVLLYIDDYVPLEYNISPTDLTCNGAIDGQVDLSVTGGIPPYTLTLTDSITGDETSYMTFPVTGLDVGTYYVEVIDGYGCTAEDIIAGSLFDAGQTFIPDGMGGSYSSIINLGGFGGSQTVETADQIQSICATMEHSRIGELEIKLMAPDGTEVILKEQPGGATCNMGEPCAQGPADAGNPGTDPGIGYNYCWQNISTYATMTGESNNFTYSYTNPCDGSTQSDKYLPAGSYQPYEGFANFIGAPLNGDWTITVTDMIPNNNGYIFDWSISLQADLPDSIFTLTQPDLPTFSEVVTNPDCGSTNGAIDLTVTDGAPPFTFLWDTGETTEDITNIGAGIYSVDVTDDSSCVYTYQINVSNTGTLGITGVVTDESCAGLDDGAIDITVTGATLPLTVVWDSGQNTEDISGLAPGVYTVNVTDNTGCEGVMTFTVNGAGNINIDGNITDENCGDQEGIIDLTIFGAADPITFTWNSGETTEDIDELVQGTYIVELTDANGCYATDTFTVINLVGNCVPNCDLEISSSLVIDETCGMANGSIDLTLFTTNGPILVNWDSGQTTEDLSGLIEGSYEVTLTDNEGCEVIQSFDIVNQTNGLSIVSINTTNEYCGNGQGAADASISGGAQPYTFSWDNGATTEDLTSVTAGTYTLTVTDANGCSAVESVTIVNDAGTLAQTYGNAADEVCSNGNGSIDIIIEGGQQPYSYLWSNGSTTEDLIGISAGTYSCTITDAGGCSISTPEYVVNNQSGDLEFNNIDVDNEVCSNGLGSIEILYTGGTGPFTYSWDNGETTQDIFNLSAGTYVGTVTDDSGCSISTGDLVLLNESGTLSLDAVSSFDELCGNGTGSINITVSGGTPPLTYNWSNGSNSEDISNLSAGNYSCTITDVNGCQVTASATVANQTGVLNIDNIIVTNENCGDGAGALDAIVSGAALPATYTWSNGGNTEDINGLNEGTYTLEVTDNNGCTTTGQATVQNITNGINLDDVQITNEVCGSGDGSIDITISGGTDPIIFSWDSGQNTEDISGLSAGTYTCTITDNSGCSIVAGPYIINNSAGSLNLSINSMTNESCGNSDGAIDIETTGAALPVTYSWDSGQNTEDISSLPAGTYVLTATDNNGCSTNISTEVINEAGTLSLDAIDITDEMCTNASGAIDITVSGGTLPYSYLWSNTAITEDIIGLNAGSYSVVITDFNGCSITSESFTVNNNSGQFTVDGINVTNEICGDGLGNVDLIVSGGTGSITYLWSSGETTQDLNNVSAGSYSGTATDVGGCTVTFSATVLNDAGNLTVDDVISDATCASNNGSIDITVNGGLDPNTYVWSTGATTEDINGLPAGIYTCNITDNNGCSLTYTGTVQNTGSPNIAAVSITDEACGNSDGSITLTINGGTEPYTYSWTGPPSNPCCTYTLDMQDQGNSWNGAYIDVYINGSLQGAYTVPGGGANIETFPVCDGDDIDLIWNSGDFDNEVSFDLINSAGVIEFSQGGDPNPGQIYTGTASCSGGTLDGNSISNLSAGNYSVVVTDVNGCQDSTTMVVNNTSGSLQVISALVTDESCSDSNGSIELTLTGADPITYSWSSGPTTEDLFNLNAGTYTVDISDGDGCTISESYTLTNFSNGLTISASTVVDENCNDGSGSIDITATGGGGTLSYNWSNGFTAEDIFGLNAGSYTVTVSDGSICDYEETFVLINNANGISASEVIVNESCGAQNGSIDLTMSGGTAPYSFLWNNGATTEDIAGLTAGTYSCLITDDVGCEIIFIYTVGGDNGGITLNANITDEDCGEFVGEIDLTVIGATGAVTYSWNSGETTEDLINITYGLYTVNVMDANGCVAIESFNVASTGYLTPDDVNIVNEDCGSGNGSIDLDYFGFGQPDSYTWSNGETTQDISNLSQGWYTVELYNQGGGGECTMIDSFYVDLNPNSLLIDSMVVTNESCSLGDGSIDVFISGGTGPMTYLWNTGDGTEDLTGLSGGIYSITVTDVAGCTYNGSAEVANYTFGFGIAAGEVTDENCGDETGAIDITVTGGALPYTFAWSSGPTSEDLTNINAGSYTVVITDNAGCEISNSFDVENSTNGFMVDVVVTDETCGDSNGAIDLTVNGGVSPITFAWSNLETTEDLSNLDGGAYSAVITDNTGCEINVDEVINSLSENFDIGTPIVVDENCGDGTGSIEINPTGGTEPLVYNWDVPNPCCSYTLNMYDLNNNGWGGNPEPEVLVYVNGTLFGNFNVPPGNGNSSNTVDIPVCSGDVIEFEYVQANQNQNNTYEVLDGEGNVIFEDGPNPFNGIAFTTTAACSAGNVNTLTGLNGGEYIVEITDDVGCVIQDTITVDNITGGFEISDVIITDENCEDGTGAIDITIAGGTPPYIISWNNGETTEDLNNLSSGIYNVNIIDDTGCEINGFYNINNVGIPVDLISANVTHASCATCPEGSISLNLDPAGAPFTFSWDNGETTQDITSLVPGFYTVTVTSTDGCVDSMTYEVINTASIDEHSGLSINISPNPSDGIFDVFIDGLDNIHFNYEIIDATGRVVVNGNEMLDNGSVLIDISKFNTGTYILKLSNEDYLFVERIVLY